MTAETPVGYRLTARPTNYQGTPMRSRLEAKVAAAFDAAAIPWEYEPHALADGAEQWLPDFRIGTGNGARAYVEVRPTIDLLRRDLPRYTRIAAVCDPTAVVIGVGFVDDDPLVAVTADGQQLRLAPVRRNGGVPTNAPRSTPPLRLLPVPAAIRRRATEDARLAKITRDLEVFRTPGGRGFARGSTPVVRPLTPNDRDEPSVADQVAAVYVDVYGRPPVAAKLRAHLERVAADCTVVEDVCHGVARYSRDRWLLDLGADYETGRVVTVTATGWRVSMNSPLPLYRYQVAPLPLPVPGGHIDDLYDLVNIDEDDFEAFADLLASYYLPGRARPHVYSEGHPVSTRVNRGGQYMDCAPVDELQRLVRCSSAYSSLFDREEYEQDDKGRHRPVRADPHRVVRFVQLQGRNSDDEFVRRSVATIQASAGRIVGALLDRAVNILAGPRELPATTGEATPDAVQLILDAFPGTEITQHTSGGTQP